MTVFLAVDIHVYVDGSSEHFSGLCGRVVFSRPAGVHNDDVVVSIENMPGCGKRLGEVLRFK